MISYLKIILVALTLGVGTSAISEEHDHDDKKEHGEEEHKHDEKEEAEHGHGEAEEEGEGSVVGPEKGITEKGPLGFKLSTEAQKTFSFKTASVAGPTLTIPKGGMVQIKMEKSVFRIRQGWFKRVPVEVIQKKSDSYLIRSSELTADDQVVISEAGFFRMAEVAAEGGASHGHSH